PKLLQPTARRRPRDVDSAESAPHAGVASIGVASMASQPASQRPGPRRSGRVAVKRAYAPHSAQDGTRILVDRLWPRGLSKDKAKIDIWLKDIAPSDGLRRRVHAGQEAWAAFVVDYGRELAQEPAASAARALRERIDREPVTLIYAARNE